MGLVYTHGHVHMGLVYTHGHVHMGLVYTHGHTWLSCWTGLGYVRTYVGGEELDYQWQFSDWKILEDVQYILAADGMYVHIYLSCIIWCWI